MNPVWIILVILAVVCVLLLISRGIKGPAHTLETISKPIEDLLIRGYDGGFLIIDAAGSKYFTQLRKYVVNSDNYGIELSFPRAAWSKEFFAQLITYCDQNGINYKVSKDQSIQNPLEFLYIDFGRNTSKAHDIIKVIFIKIFCLNKNTKLFVRLENASLR